VISLPGSISPSADGGEESGFRQATILGNSGHVYFTVDWNKEPPTPAPLWSTRSRAHNVPTRTGNSVERRVMAGV
jgi:hypothetical protein